MPKLEQNIQVLALRTESLAQLLHLKELRFVSPDVAHRQLAYVEKYVRDLGCRSIVVENHYIDRDYMEDHSIFYAKSLYPYGNHCRRLHFFQLAPRQIAHQLRQLRREVRDSELYHDRCRQFSLQHYLGFSVIKPLDGCPLGRTVLRCFPEEKDKTYQRRFDCACEYRAHLLGIPLQVRGLAFQQQDLGVSACATTALWSALQRTREIEESSAATPAQITMRASQYTLPFGRAMPSGGLSLDQMCQAVHSLGYAPNLYRAETFEVSRALLYSAVLSGISPVLIVEQKARDLSHAVAVAGMKIRKKHELSPNSEFMDDRATDLVALYIHDDRLGPYLRAQIQKRAKTLSLELPLQPPSKSENWALTHILIPLHSKIRLSFGELRATALKIVADIHAFRASILKSSLTITSWECRIVRSPKYVESQVLSDLARDTIVDKLCRTVPFPRYFGLVRIEAEDLDPTDILLDTTSTERNLNSLAVVQVTNSRRNTASIGAFLSAWYDCHWIL